MSEISIERFNEVMDALEAGTVRVAEKVDGKWRVNAWVKETILAGFKLGIIRDMSQGQFSFCDKDTFPVRRFTPEDGVRIVPGGSSIRRGAYLAPGSIVMPPTVHVPPLFSVTLPFATNSTFDQSSSPAALWV